MTVLDVSIVNVALPTIGEKLHFSQGNLQWVVTAYALTFGGFLLLGGRAADYLGRRRVFMVGLALFTIASLVCGLANSEGMLMARVRSRGSAPQSSRRPRFRSSRRSSMKARSATRRSASGARWGEAAPRSACLPE